MIWTEGRRISAGRGGTTTRIEYTSGHYTITPTRGGRYTARYKDDQLGEKLSQTDAKRLCQEHHAAEQQNPEVEHPAETPKPRFVGNVPPDQNKIADALGASISVNLSTGQVTHHDPADGRQIPPDREDSYDHEQHAAEANREPDSE